MTLPRHKTLRRRTAAAACALTAFVSLPAFAADYSPPMEMLPPPDPPAIVLGPSYPSWEGVYFGLTGGRSFGKADFGNGTQSLISYILRNTELEGPVSGWTTLPSKNTSTDNYGGFVGFNTQWEEIVLGLEADYSRVKFGSNSASTTGPIVLQGATMNDGTTVKYSVSTTGSAVVQLHDIATVRARAGWAVDRLLPYAFAGVAVGRVDSTRFASVSGTKTTQAPPYIDPNTGLTVTPGPVTGPLNLPSSPQTETKNNQFAYGVAAGFGIEYGILPNLFLRAEWEYVQFAPVSDLKISTNTVRVGIGLKF